MDSNLISSPGRSRPPLFSGCHAPPSSWPARGAAAQSAAAPASARRDREMPIPGQPAARAPTSAARSNADPDREPLLIPTPRCRTSFTASSLNSRLIYRRYISILLFPKHLISVSTEPPAAQAPRFGIGPHQSGHATETGLISTSSVTQIAEHPNFRARCPHRARRSIPAEIPFTAANGPARPTGAPGLPSLPQGP